MDFNVNFSLPPTKAILATFLGSKNYSQNMSFSFHGVPDSKSMISSMFTDKTSWFYRQFLTYVINKKKQQTKCTFSQLKTIINVI